VRGVLNDLRVVEAASFIAAPSCGLHLAQLGAEVVRIDQVGGGPDFRRWPQAADGTSLYWEGLNKGKKSVALDLRSPEGRQLAVRLITAPGPNAGLFVTNFPAQSFLGHPQLAAHRPDLVSVRVSGWPDGRQAVDYTVNCAVGLPLMTGPERLGDEPVNHVLPTWDLLTGSLAAFNLVAAERRRRMTGEGAEIVLPLSDVAIATMGNLGQIAEVEAGGDRPRFGNDLFGAFGRDFVTADGVRVMIVAITARQWEALVSRLALADRVAALEAELGISFAVDEGLRFTHRARLLPLFEAAIAERTFAELDALFESSAICWGRYRTLKQGLRDEPSFSARNPMLQDVDHPSGRYLTPGSAASRRGEERAAPVRAPRLGEHTDEVLADILGMPSHEIARLHDRGLAAGPR
jgi:2-methylfumaryl-CoA isomerase